MNSPSETPDEALNRNLQRIRTEGLDAATDAALSLLRDPKAPAQAKSATINAMYRASGLFGRSDDDERPELHEMTPAQIDQAIRKLSRDLMPDGTGDVSGVFE